MDWETRSGLKESEPQEKVLSVGQTGGRVKNNFQFKWGGGKIQKYNRRRGRKNQAEACGGT